VIRPRATAGLFVLAAALGACSSSAPAKPTQSAFDASTQPSCMRHQEHGPNSLDKGKPDIARSLTVLRYYGAHGAERFCDNKPATATDLTWMRFYVAQGADPAAVSRWLPHP